MQVGEEAKDEVRDWSYGREPREGAEGGTGATGAYGERCGGLYGGRDAGEIKKRKSFLFFSNNAYLSSIKG
ncbi:MAG: hypothetical protein IKQ77_05215 [Prevotella sp.]|nr:hypothetical protein [Prevotella sp.]